LKALHLREGAEYHLVLSRGRKQSQFNKEVVYSHVGEQFADVLLKYPVEKIGDELEGFALFTAPGLNIIISVSCRAENLSWQACRSLTSTTKT
jgi:hypothetical protein